MAGRKRLGEMLLDARVIDQNQLDAALGHQRRWGGRLGQALVDLRLTTEARVVEALSRKFGYEVVQVAGLEAGPALEAALKLVPREAASRHNVLPYAADTSSVSVAMSDPGNISVVDEIRFRTGRRVKVALAGDREIAAAVRRFYYPGEGEPAGISLDVGDDDSGPAGAVQPGSGSTNALDRFFAAPAAGAAAPPGAGAPTGGPLVLEDSPGARSRAAAGTPALGRPPASPVPGRASVPPAPAPAARAAAPSPAVRPTATSPARPTPSPAGTAPPGEEPAEKSGTVELPLDAEIPPEAEGEDLWSLGPVKAPAPPPAAAPRPAAPPPAAARPATAPLAAGRGSPGRELEVLEAIDQLAHGEPAVPELVKPSQLAAALLRLLVRKKVVTFEELLEELGRK